MNAGPTPAAAPGRPMWLVCLAYAAAGALVICWPAWPGQMTYDPLYALERSFLGIEHMTWPPMHTYLFWLSRKAGLGAGGLFAAQTFLLFLGAGLSATLLVRHRLWALAAMAAFALAFIAVPPLLGVALSQWRDVTVASFAVMSLAFWLLAAQRRQAWLLALAALMLGVSVSLRYNAFPLFALMAPLMAWRPFLEARPAPGLRAFAVAVLAVSIGLAWASWQWRLPDFKRMPSAVTSAQIQLFDLMGVSACEGRNFLPPAVSGGRPMTPAQVRAAYDPRHVQLSYGPRSDRPEILPTDGGGAVQKAWRETIPHHLGCYLDHRRVVAMEQLGLAKRGVFYPAHGRIDDNRMGVTLAHPRLSDIATAYVNRNAGDLWRRPAWLYLSALLVTGLLAWRRDPRTGLMLALTAGAWANVALLFLIGPAADARYIFPSNVFCAFVIAAGAAMLIEGPGERRTRR
ncbi:hypothetical protein ACO2Q0_18350 [Phenylobacterium sp. VNQ135]|uniref:hypothetical protein n=1 Tax=Phenylobacterium sp. VNQ135 TaxID=3400922 RepID=UPI003C007432